MLNFYTTWKDKYKENFCVDTKVISFINHFINASGEDPEKIRNHFLNGGCYWFTTILKERFQSSNRQIRIWYDVKNNHFLTEIDNTLYDASGAYFVESEEDYDSIYVWRDYQFIDTKHAARITAQCINYEEKEK